MLAMQKVLFYTVRQVQQDEINGQWEIKLVNAFLLVFFPTLIVSVMGTYFFKQFAIHRSIMDLPNERSMHVQPTPRGGGIIFVSIFYAVLLLLFFSHHIRTTVFLALLGGLPVAIVGYCDDLYTVKIQWRIVIHFLSALWGVVCLHVTPALFLLFPVVLTVWFINFYNFMDGIDGLAGSEAVFVSAVAGFILLSQHQLGLGLICIALCAAVLGFLVWNWAPAKIFMGDIGSGFLGYCFAILMWSTSSQQVLPLFFWWILLGVFLSDATYTLFSRMIQKKKWHLPHREHIYQRLVQHGYRHDQITLILMVVNFIFLLPAALMILFVNTFSVELLFVSCLALITGISWYVCYKNFSLNL